MQLSGKVAIVTGSGGGGAGRATARRFAREGASVVVSDINYAGGQETVNLIRSEGGAAVFCLADVRSEENAQSLVSFAESGYGGLDILVNNASNPDGMGTLTGWAEAVSIEILAPMYTTLAAIEAMRRRGGGAIVNIGSTSALGHGKKHSAWPAYDTGKMAQMRLTTALGRLKASDNIRVNCLVPAWIASPAPKAYWESLTPEQRKERGVPETLLSLEEVAGAILRLATDETLFGRLMVWWNGEPPRLIAESDPGFGSLV
ncbi:MAG TPA: SDR family NAD(P)-dependent oxidoreductase [Verrucomicrobiae bacterium]|nr:SDR family NAD(P)-dependent oxidoreductase [Verrucomicrobiae bacterium]